MVTIQVYALSIQFCHDFCNLQAKIAPKSRWIYIFVTDLHPWLQIFHPVGVTPEYLRFILQVQDITYSVERQINFQASGNFEQDFDLFFCFLPIKEIRIAYTLNLKCMTSPSCTTYSLPSTPIFPASLTACSEPYFTKSSYLITSARINPFSKSV